MSILAALIALAFGLVAPSWAVALAAIPVLILENAGLIPSLGTAVGVPLRSHDALLGMAMLRLLLRVVHHRATILPRVVFILGLYLGYVLLASLLATAGEGTGPLIGVTSWWYRAAIQSSVLAIAAAVALEEPPPRVRQVLLITGVAAGGTVALGYLFGPILPFLGEVQGIERGLPRAFGLVGDNAGYLLAFFALWMLLERRWLPAAGFTATVLLTGTIGALTTLLAGGLLTLLWREAPVDAANPALSTRQRTADTVVRRAAIVTVGLAALAALSFFSPLAVRLTDQSIISSGSGAQRMATMAIAVKAWLESPVIGGGAGLFAWRAELAGAEQILDARTAGGFQQGAIATAGNQYLQILADSGVIGLALFLTLLVTLIRTLGRGERWERPTSSRLFAAGQRWVLALAIGNQSALWLNPSNPVFLLVLFLAGLAVAVTTRRPARPVYRTVV